MGVYDVYKGVQIKAGECILKDYQVGDKCDLDDGVYVSYEGVIIIKDGIFIAKFDELLDKWGGRLSLESVVSRNNPINQVIDQEPSFKKAKDFKEFFSDDQVKEMFESFMFDDTETQLDDEMVDKLIKGACDMADEHNNKKKDVADNSSENRKRRKEVVMNNCCGKVKDLHPDTIIDLDVWANSEARKAMDQGLTEDDYKKKVDGMEDSYRMTTLNYFRDLKRGYIT